MSAPIEKLLAALPSARQRQPSQWMARCPAHDDKTPSLSVSEAPGGVVLLRCFAGCEVADVVAAMGLRLNDLFPAHPWSPTGPHHYQPPRQRLLNPLDALRLLEREANIVTVTALNIGHGVPIAEVDRARCLLSARRINEIVLEVTS